MFLFAIIAGHQGLGNWNSGLLCLIYFSKTKNHLKRKPNHRSLLINHRSGTWIVKLLCRCNNGFTTCVFNKLQTSPYLGSHASFCKLSLGQVMFHFGHRNPIQFFFSRLMEVDIYIGDIGKDNELVGANFCCQQ